MSLRDLFDPRKIIVLPKEGMTVTTRIELGDKARDTISGWEGIVTSRHEYLNGCIRWAIGARDKDGKPEELVFDDQQIEVIEKHAWSDPSATTPPPPDAPPARPSVGGPRDHSAPARR